ncbi:hypothetical protein ON010_g12341 [Phytophthora cinnamomi]|nr:hypothetical protein ON010_g12341 [Phytophthora cinnamomi]
MLSTCDSTAFQRGVAWISRQPSLQERKLTGWSPPWSCVHSLGGRPAAGAELQPLVSAGELPDEVLLLPHHDVAPAALRGRGARRQDRRLRPGQDGGRGVGAARPHHVAGGAAHAPQVRPGHQAHAGCPVYDIEKGYYADGEDAYDMRMPFTEKCNQAFASQVNRFKKVLAEKDAEKEAKAAKEASA